jgi:hypothetical protein
LAKGVRPRLPNESQSALAARHGELRQKDDEG